MAVIKKVGIKESGSTTVNVKDVGAEAQNVNISYNGGGQVIEDITEPGVVISSTKSAAKAIKDINNDIKTKASQEAVNAKVPLVDGKVPSQYLPSYADDIIEGYYNAEDGKFYEESTYTTEISGAEGIIYVDLGEDSMYRWESGSGFIEILNATNKALSSLTDVNIAGAQSGEALTYDAASGKWVNRKVTSHIVHIPTVVVGSYTYNGQPQGPTISNLDPDFYDYVTVTGATATNAGNYTLRFSLKNTFTTCWSDMTTTDKTYSWSIAKATGNITLAANSVTLDSDHPNATVNVTATGNITVSSSDTSVATASVSNNVITINNVNEESGEATITVNSAANTNYTAVSKTISVSAEFTIYALVFNSDNDFKLKVNNSSPNWDGIVEYSIDKGNTWFIWDGSQLNSTANQPIYLRGSGNTVISNSEATFGFGNFTGKYCEGNIENLLDYQTVKNGGHPTMANSCFAELFRECSSLLTPPELPATTLANDCYNEMFDGCTLLTTAPELPATTLANNCYQFMFRNCSALTIAPALPATTLKERCYNGMFYGCTSLTTVPTLPATTLANNCYYSMFENCTSLITAPEILATTIGGYSACSRMFAECTNLVTSPSQLYSTELEDECYSSMFMNCTSLTSVPIISATTRVKRAACVGMFSGCISLITASSISLSIGSAISMGERCCLQMFKGCTSLIAAPVLPARRLGEYCYYEMFNGCTSLATVPALPANQLSGHCYEKMFSGCTSLNTLPALPATTLSSGYYSNMFSHCSNIGISQTKNSYYNIEYRIPSNGTGTGGTFFNMISNTGGTYTGNLAVNITYYTKNTIIS